jgi:hypothetical protein
MMKMILVVQHPNFQRWHANNKKSLEHLHFNFMQKLHQVFIKLASFSLNSKNTHAIKHNAEHPEFYLKDINSAVKLASTFFKKMQDNIDNESMTGRNVPAFANVLPVLVSAKHPHLNVGDESTTHHTNHNFDARGLKRPKKECLPRTNLGLVHAKPGSDQGLFPRLRGKPPCNKSCIQGRVCDKLCQICKFAHVASWKMFEKDNQEAILEHANKTGNIWLDKATFKNQSQDSPDIPASPG